jgi:hypothetical protein
MPEAEQSASALTSDSAAPKAGTIASDANEVKTVPPHWIREKLHTGHGNYKWSEPFDPIERAKEEQAAEDERLKQRGSFPAPEPAKD